MTNKLPARPGVKPVSEDAKIYGRTVTRVQVAAAVWDLWNRVRKEHGLDQQWLADRMGKDKSWASRLLKTPGNWTLDTVGELLEAMGGRITMVEAQTYEHIAQGKTTNSSRSLGSKLILKIEAEIMIDDPHQPDLIERPSISLGSIKKQHFTTLEEMVEAS